MNSVFENWDFSIIGNSHLSSNKVKQDYSYSKITKNKAVAIVADGHGSSRHIRSEKGAEIAVKCTVSALDDFVRNLNVNIFLCESKRNGLLRQLTDSIVYNWKEHILAEFNENPLTDEEKEVLKKNYGDESLDQNRIERMYGTTLIAFIITRTYAFGFQIGDGKAFIIKATGELSQAIVDDEKCFLNTTTSLSDENAYEEFRYCYFDSKDVPICAFVSTDGIDKLYGDGEILYNFYRTVFIALSQNKKTDCVNELQELLKNLSPSSDDMSISCLYNKKLIKNNPLVTESVGDVNET